MYCVAYKNHCRKNKKNFADVAINNICEDREKAYNDKENIYNDKKSA